MLSTIVKEEYDKVLPGITAAIAQLQILGFM
jgi:hypothetical protein